MIRKNLITALILLNVLFAFSQENKTYTVSGVMIDYESKRPLEFVSVAIYKIPDTTLITGAITNAKGEFLLSRLNSGQYLIKSSFVGYQTDLKKIEIINASLNLSEPIFLTTSSVSLSEVQISANRSEKQHSIEKTKINVAQNISSVSGNITEVLKSFSFVSIDSEENIYLRGNKNILILIDGVPTTVSSLNSIPASNVDNIEIITNPDARYDAEGTAGIINIVTKRQNISGFSGAVSLNYGFNNRLNGGLSLNYSKGIWDLGFSYNGKYEKTEINSNLTRHLYSPYIFVEQEINSTQISSTNSAVLLLTAKPNKKEIFSLSMKIVTPKLNNVQEISGKQNDDLFLDFLFNRKNDINFSRKTIENKLTYKRIFEKNKNEISFDASFSRTKGSRPAEYYIENILLQKSEGGGAPTNIALQADYFKTVFKNGIIEFGLKGFSRWNSFDYKFYDLDMNSSNWNLNPAFSNDLEHHEYIYSSYLMYSDSLFKKIFYKIGTRIEYNTSELVQKSINDVVYNEYLIPFPYLLLKRNLNKSNSVALSINRRITRPNYPQLNPFINVIDQMTYETGNKNLEPEILDKVEFNYSHFKEKFQFRTNIYYSTTKDFITQVSMLSVPDKLIITYINGDKQNKIGSDFDINYKINKSLSINPGLSVFYSKSSGQYNEIDLSTNNLAWTGNLKTTIKPLKKTEILLFINYNSPIELPQFKVSEIYYADIAVKRSFYDNRFTASLTLTDIFNTRTWELQSENTIYKLNNFSKSETRILWLGLSYNFNSFKQTRTSKNGDNENDGGIIKLGQ